MDKKDLLIVTLFLALFMCVGSLVFLKKNENRIVYIEKDSNSKTSTNSYNNDYVIESYECGQSEDFVSLINKATKAIERDSKRVMGFNNRAYGYLKVGNLEAAEKDLKTALDLNSDFPLALNNRGLLRIKQGEFDLALKDVEKVEQIDSTIPEIYLNKGLIFAGKSQFGNAIKELTKAIEMKPNLAIAYEERAKVYKLLNENQKADEDTLKAKQICRYN